MKNIKNEEAVSPVIGVILMVVITVIVAAILAVFAFGIGAPVKAPETKLRFVATNNSPMDNLTITNVGGDSLILAEETIMISMAADNTQILPSTNLSAFGGGEQYLAPGRTINGTFGGTAVDTGDIINLQIVHVPTGQMIADTRVTVQ